MEGLVQIPPKLGHFQDERTGLGEPDRRPSKDWTVIVGLGSDELNELLLRRSRERFLSMQGRMLSRLLNITFTPGDELYMRRAVNLAGDVN